MATERKDAKEEVLSELIGLIGEDKLPWHNGMVRKATSLAFNGVTGRRYGALNQFRLLGRDFADPRFYGQGQIKKMKKYIKKGEKATHLLGAMEVERNYKPTEEHKEAGLEIGEVIAEEGGKFLRSVMMPVFNASQINGIEPYYAPISDFEPSEIVEHICKEMAEKTGLKFEIADCVPCYSPYRHLIKMPGPSSFLTIEDYEGTRLHELAHSTGSPKILGRFVEPQSRSPQDYAREELLAEMSAALLCVQFGLPMSLSVKKNHAAYLQHYAEQLKADRFMLFSVGKEAMKIVECIEGFAPKMEMMADPSRAKGDGVAISERAAPRLTPRM